MQITPINNHQQNFNGVYLIQVERKGFIKPDDLPYVKDIFTKALRANTKEINPKIAKFLAYFGFGKHIKTISFLEQINYAKMMNDEQTGYIKPIDEKYHSFYVYTKEHKNRAIKALTPRKRYFMRDKVEGKEEAKQFKTGIKYDSTDTNKRANELFMMVLKRIRGNEPVKIFQIPSLSKLPDVVSEIRNIEEPQIAIA